MIDDMLERETDDAPLNESNPIEAARCSGCGSTKCPECDGRKDAVRAVMVELHQFAQWIRSGAVSHEDARDDMARALENRIRGLEKGWNLPLSTELGIVACMRLNAKLQAKLDHWKKESGYETPEEMVEAVTVRFKNELPKGLGRSLWLLEQLDRKKAEDALTQARTDIVNLLANIDEMLKTETDLLEDDDRAVVEDVRKRWISDFGDARPAGSTGYPDYEATDPVPSYSGAAYDRTLKCVACGGVAHAWTPDGRGWCERHSGGHNPPAEMPLTPEFVSQLWAESPSSKLVRQLRDRVHELTISLDSVRANYRESQERVDVLEKETVEAHKVFLTSTAIQVSENARIQQELAEARKANEEWAEQDKKSARQLIAALAERDAARFAAAQRLQQCLNQTDIDNRAIKEWERTLGEAVDFLRALLADKATTLQRENAGSLIKGFDSRRKAGTTLVKYPTDKTGCLCGGVGCNSCEPQGRG